MAKKTWIQLSLEDWALWDAREGAGFAKETPISRIISGNLPGDAGRSAPPVDVDASAAWMQKIVVAMGDLLKEPRKGKYINTMREYYRKGPQGAGKALNMPKSTVRRHTRTGEDMLRQKLKE